MKDDGHRRQPLPGNPFEGGNASVFLITGLDEAHGPFGLQASQMPGIGKGVADGKGRVAVTVEVDELASAFAEEIERPSFIDILYRRTVELLALPRRQDARVMAGQEDFHRLKDGTVIVYRPLFPGLNRLGCANRIVEPVLSRYESRHIQGPSQPGLDSRGDAFGIDILEIIPQKSQLLVLQGRLPGGKM